jgi:hypothetical protein
VFSDWESTVFSDSEVWRFQGKTKYYWLWKWGLETFCNNIRERQVSKLHHLRKIGSQISVLSCIKITVIWKGHDYGLADGR